ncbi:hypothetical protein [Leuconostoc gasicomitatum]|uniref:hypothetical protein n=1 Tax=Leuconostoc gasicomitatum TaxID=115778 RepID=UPI0007E08CB6|nr:hypothetical protein [Leuconostoc gasicomitatum]CUW06666.1 hypothetical protein PB1E_0734 [Leuconostoc gasicomitatum]
MSISIDPIQIENINQIVKLTGNQAKTGCQITDLTLEIADLNTKIEEQRCISKHNYDLVCGELYKLRIENKDLKMAHKQLEQFVYISSVLIILMITAVAVILQFSN